MAEYSEGDLVDMHCKGRIIGQGRVSSLRMLHGLAIPLDHTHMWVTSVFEAFTYQNNVVEVGAPIAWPLLALTLSSGLPSQASAARPAEGSSTKSQESCPGKC